MSPRIDAHHHLWDLAVRPQDWISGPEMAAIDRDFLIEEFESLAAANGVHASVLVQTVCVPAETPEFLAIAERSPLIQAVVGWVDLESPDVVDRLAELSALPGGRYLRGIRHQVQSEADPDWLLRPAVQRGLQAVGRAGLQFDLVLRPDQLGMAARAVRRLPDVGFVLDHAGKPPIASGELTHWQTDLAELGTAPNLRCKLSGLMTEAAWGSWSIGDLRPVVERLLAGFGPDRLMIGSDWPVSTLAGDYARIWTASEELISGLSGAERAAVGWRTAAAAYRIPVVY